MCSNKLCVHKKTFLYLDRSDYQCPPSESMCQVRNIPFDEQTGSFFSEFRERIYFFKETKKSIEDAIGDV